ncbi:mechanosensitive ion channel family protein [Candidatus Micrarchaeota archaeon]|nr:mechanosensitive ion channel family protein [Candidatus Micrarchaeota archaeon]MBU1939391.1 mechanosensitive ion channel family protein [Candidatus Micrarchaeota archaeon]
MTTEGKTKQSRFSNPAVLAMYVFGTAAIAVFLYVYGSFILGIILAQLLGSTPIDALMPALINTAALLIGTQAFLMLSRFAISRYLGISRRKGDIKVLLSLYTYAVWGIVGVIIIAGFFKDVGALLTSLGLIGFGITFALQKPILNFVGWLTIILTSPFGIGDRIEVSGIRGDVLSIHVMYTRLQGTRLSTQQRSEQVITIPNEFILTNPLMNYSRMGEAYTDEVVVSVTYESNWKKAAELLERVAMEGAGKYAKTVPATRKEKAAWQEAIKLLQGASKKIKKGFVKEAVKESIGLMKSAEDAPAAELPKPNMMVSLADSSINISATYQTDLRSLRSTKNEIVRQFLEEVEKSKDIEIAYPHMQIVAGGKTKGIAKGGKSLAAFFG